MVKKEKCNHEIIFTHVSAMYIASIPIVFFVPVEGSDLVHFFV